jgi:hypothetical protein
MAISAKSTSVMGTGLADTGVANEIITAVDAATTGLAAQVANSVTAQACINIPLSGAILAAGTPMAAWADNAGASAPGITLVNSEAYGLRWNNQGTQTAVWFGVVMPQDLDSSANVILHALGSKIGATVGDATTLTVTAFFQTVAALHDADADLGGVSSALVGDATSKTVAELTLTLATANVPASPSVLSLSVKPTAAVLGTDDFVLHGLWLEYTRLVLSA